MQQQDVGHVGHVAMSWQMKEAIDVGPIGGKIYIQVILLSLSFHFI